MFALGVHNPKFSQNIGHILRAADATLGKLTLERCKHKVYVPTNICMNLSACVNVVLYDRLSKQK